MSVGGWWVINMLSMLGHVEFKRNGIRWLEAATSVFNLRIEEEVLGHRLVMLWSVKLIISNAN